VPPPAPAPPTPPAPGQVLDLAKVLRDAGLDSPVASAEVARDFGHILRIVVGGVMEVLKARQQVKGEFRVEITTFRSAENNPLKFSVDVQDALHNLLVKRHPKYLGPVDAFEDAFGDIRAHEVAMLAGMRAAFEAMLARFDPVTLQEEFDRQLKKNALVAVPGRLRYWDLYCEKIRDMVRDPETSFRDLFGDEFAKAYEEQLSRLKARRRDASS
jgi:type VI secretion system FHA domain protein